jgi:hypothetical protein
MTRGEFEKEMDQYIAQRRKANFTFSLFGKKPKQVKMEPAMPPEVQKYDESSPAEPLETIPGEEMPAKKGMFTRLLESVGLVASEEKKPESIPAAEVEHMLVKDELMQDTKEIAKIALAAIKHLPAETLSAFKSGPEFARLKELLKKHQLIK